jgi:hypothetical protein
MIKVFFLIFEPGRAWDKIAQARRGFMFITINELLPLILLGTALDAWGLYDHGKWQPRFQMFRTFSNHEILLFEAVQFFLLFAMVFVSALMVFKISQTFHDRLTFLEAFTTVAYGFSPTLLAGFLNFFATMHPAVSWLLGSLATIWILYQGIPRVMRPDPTHAFGVYLSGMSVVILTSGLVRLITAMYLLGYMDLKHSWLAYKLAHLLGH